VLNMEIVLSGGDHSLMLLFTWQNDDDYRRRQFEVMMTVSEMKLNPKKQASLFLIFCLSGAERKSEPHCKQRGFFPFHSLFSLLSYWWYYVYSSHGSNVQTTLLLVACVCRHAVGRWSRVPICMRQDHQLQCSWMDLMKAYSECSWKRICCERDDDRASEGWRGKWR
jgi:hypothetical protein